MVVGEATGWAKAATMEVREGFGKGVRGEFKKKKWRAFDQ